MTIRASRGARLLVAAALAWLGLAMYAQAAHATYGQVSVAKINNGGDPNDQFSFKPTLMPTAGTFSLKGGQSSSIFSVECNIDRPGHSGECATWGYPTLKFTEQQTPGYTLTDITCRYTQGTNGYGAAVTTGSPLKPAGEVTKDLAAGTVSLKIHWYETVKCWFTNTKNPPPTGTIKVTKSLVPSTDSGRFNLLIDGATKAGNVGDGGTTGVVTVPAGTHTVGESAVAGTSLSDYSSTLSCTNTKGGATDSDGVLAVANGDAWECVIINARKTQPPPPVTPPTPPTPAPPVAPPPPVTPQIKVSPERVKTGTAKLRGPSGCSRTGTVAATVSGRRIVKVTFYVDGKKVKTLHKANGKGGTWVLPLNIKRLAYGAHRVRVSVQFAKSSQTKTKALRFSFDRCHAAAAQAQFTG
jgi:hypothetical protein